MTKRNIDAPLATAVRAGDVAAVKAAIQPDVNVDARDRDGFTALMVAAGLGHLPMVALLLKAGADVLASEPRMGATALHKAAQSGSVDVIALLLAAGAFIDQQTPVLGNTPLIDAVLYKQEHAVRLLLARSARTTIRNHWQQSAVELADAEGLDAIARLIEARDRADAQAVSMLTLLSAAKAGDLGEVKRQIATGALVGQRAPVIGSLDDDYTPLGIATREGHWEVVKALLDAGADPGEPIGLMRGTSIHEAAYFGHGEILGLFLDAPGGSPSADVLDAQGAYNGFTALHDAVWHGHQQAALRLIAAGARPDLRSHAGLTPRELALSYGYDDLAR